MVIANRPGLANWHIDRQQLANSPLRESLPSCCLPACLGGSPSEAAAAFPPLFCVCFLWCSPSTFLGLPAEEIDNWASREERHHPS